MTFTHIVKRLAVGLSLSKLKSVVVGTPNPPLAEPTLYPTSPPTRFGKTKNFIYLYGNQTFGVMVIHLLSLFDNPLHIDKPPFLYFSAVPLQIKVVFLYYILSKMYKQFANQSINQKLNINSGICQTNKDRRNAEKRCPIVPNQ